MFRITAETCRSFTFAEILILAAMNVETIRMGSEGSVRPKTTATQREYLSAAQALLTVRKALQV
jgi:hypothetical protein